jgi:hypothetical protein
MTEIPTGHMHTVGQLRELLAMLPQDAFVVMSRDEEGNGYSPFAEADICWYAPDTTWYGEARNIDPTDEEEGVKREGDLFAVCLWPVN